jgi:hypothetical protein
MEFLLPRRPGTGNGHPAAKVSYIRHVTAHIAKRDDSMTGITVGTGRVDMAVPLAGC